MELTIEERNTFESLLMDAKNKNEGGSLTELCIVMLEFLPHIKEKRIRLCWIQQVRLYTKEMYKMTAMYYS